MSMPIGQHLRSIRKTKAMTLQQLADRTGLSIGYLSSVERDLVSPTVRALSDICAALETDMTSFLQPLSPRRQVLRKAARETVFGGELARLRYEAITPGGFRMKGLCITVAPGGTSCELEGLTDGSRRLHTHASDELGIILQGTLELVIGDQTYYLEEGDTFCIESGVPHWFRNPGNVDSIHYSINV